MNTNIQKENNEEKAKARLLNSFDYLLSHNGSGEFKMDLWRVRCSKCGKTFAPLAKFIGLERYQTKSNEIEKLVIEAVS